MTDTFATIRGTARQLTQLADLASGGYHDDIYLTVQDDAVHTLMQTGGRKVMSYTTFDPEFFFEVDGDAEAFIPVEKYRDYLQVAEADGTVEVSLQGEEDPDAEHPRLATHLEARGSMNTRVRLPGSADDLSKVPWRLPTRFNERHEFISKANFDDDWNLTVQDPDDQKVPPTTITVDAGVVAQKIVDVAEFAGDGEADYFPVVVDDGVLTFDHGRDGGDDAIWGDIEEAEVDGLDVANDYKSGFDDLIGVLDGDVTLATAPTPDDADDAPLIVTQAGDHYVTRHVLGSYTRD